MRRDHLRGLVFLGLSAQAMNRKHLRGLPVLGLRYRRLAAVASHDSPSKALIMFCVLLLPVGQGMDRGNLDRTHVLEAMPVQQINVGLDGQQLVVDGSLKELNAGHDAGRDCP